MIPPTSKTPASVGRVVHVYSRRWRGPRSGIVVMGPWASAQQIRDGSRQLVNVNVFLDGANDTAVLAECRARPEGNTWTSVDLFDELDQHQRDILGKQAEIWCEWPPRV